MKLPPLSPAEQIWWATAAGLLLLLAATVALSLIDRRLLDGVGVWAKPLKFQISLAIHAATLALIVHAFSAGWRNGALILAVAALSAASSLGEIAYMMVQAARQQHSHFNLATPFHRTMYGLMAVGAVVITGAAGIVGVVALADGQARLDPPLRLAVGLGLVGGTILTLIVAFTMGGRLDRHVGVALPGAATTPLAGWSRTVGDLRVPHFFATHMMQAIPIVGLAAERLLAAPAAMAVVVCSAAAWAALTVHLYLRALSGQPWRLW